MKRIAIAVLCVLLLATIGATAGVGFTVAEQNGMNTSYRESDLSG